MGKIDEGPIAPHRTGACGTRPAQEVRARDGEGLAVRRAPALRRRDSGRGLVRGAYELERPGLAVVAAPDLRVQEIEEPEPAGQIRPTLSMPATRPTQVGVAADARPDAVPRPARRHVQMQAEP